MTVTEPDAHTRLVEATGIVYDESRTLAQRSIRVTMRRTFLFEEGLFARERAFLDKDVEPHTDDLDQQSNGGPMRRVGGHMEIVSQGEIEGQRVSSHGNVTQDTVTTSAEKKEKGGVWENAHASGGVAEAGGDRDLPLILPPWGLPTLKGILLSGGDGLTLSHSGRCPFIAIANGANLVIDSDVDIYLKGSLEISGGGRLIITEKVKRVCLYVEQDVLVEEESAVVNLAGRAASFSILGTERRSSIRIDSRKPFRGTIYAPNSAIRIGPEADIHGAVYGKTMHVSRGARVRYDEALRSMHFPSPGFTVVSRQEL